MIKRVLRSTVCVIFIFISALCLAGCGAGNEDDDENYFLLGLTTFSNLKGGNVSVAKSQMVELIKEIDLKVSINNPESDLTGINNAKQGEEIIVSDYTYEMVMKAKEYYEFTDKSFNIAVYPLVELWGFSSINEEHYHEPRPEPTEEALELCNIDLNQLSAERKVIEGKSVGVLCKKQDGIKIDLGGIAKGYVTDKCIEILIENNVESGIITVGGNLYAYGEKPGATDYTIGISSPRGNGFFGKLSCNSVSVVSSGDSERFYIYGNERYHHIIDGATRKPAGIGMTDDERVIFSVVVNESSALADSCATAVMVMGKSKGIEFLEKNSLSGIIITKDLKYYIVGDLKINDINGSFQKG